MDSRFLCGVASLRVSQRPTIRHARLLYAATRSASAATPSHDLPDTNKPGKVQRRNDENVTLRNQSEPADATNPFLQGYKSPSGQPTTSTATADTMTPESPPPSNPSAFPSFKGTNLSNPAATMAQTMQQNSNPPPSFTPRVPNSQNNVRLRTRTRVEEQAKEKNLAQQARALEFHAARQWQQGDVYAPHDLSSVEQAKARVSRQPNSRFHRMQVNSRKMGGPDVLDELRLDPRLEYKNFSMIAELTTEMGRIKGRAETGLRAVNQRRVSKAVRRAIGIGLMPSVHKHPELMSERRAQRYETGHRRPG